MAREVAGRRQARQWFGCTSPGHWVALAPTRFALRALDECAELFGPAGGCCAAVRPGRFGARRARSASAPQSGALRKFWAHGALGEPKSPRRTGPKCSTGKTKVVEHIEKIGMASVPQRPSHHNRHNRVFHIEGPPGTLMTTPLDTPVDVPGNRQLGVRRVVDKLNQGCRHRPMAPHLPVGQNTSGFRAGFK